MEPQAPLEQPKTKPVKTKQEPYTVDQLTEQYFEVKRGNKGTNLRHSQKIKLGWLASRIKNLLPDDDSFLNWTRENNLNPSTIRGYIELFEQKKIN